MIMLAEVYTPEEDPLAVLARRDRGAISVYARGRDYHDLVKKRLKRLGALAGGGDRGGDQGLRRHRAGDGEAAGRRRRGSAGRASTPTCSRRELGNWFFLGAIFTDAGAAARRAGGGSLRVVPGLPRRLPDRGAAGALPARCAAVHQLPDDRARRAGGRRSCGRCSATASTAATTAWRSVRGTSSRPTAREVGYAGAGGAGGAAAGGSGGARRRGLPADVQRVADQADRAEPLRAQRGLCDRQLRRAGARCRWRGGWRRTRTRWWRDAGAWAAARLS